VTMIEDCCKYHSVILVDTEAGDVVARKIWAYG